MAQVQCYQGTEAQADSVVAIVDKALAYPRIGTHVGGGSHVAMPATWDGLGATPPGWTKQHTQAWVANASDAAVPLSDADAAELNQAEAQARLSQAERDSLAAALSARVNIEIEGRSPKAEAAVAAARDLKGKP